MGEANETGLYTNGGYDIFVARYNADGTLAWAKQAGGTGSDFSYSIASLGEGSCVVTGYFTGIATFGKDEPNETVLDSVTENSMIFVARYNPDGTLAWAKKAGGLNLDKARAVAATGSGGSAITGKFKATAVFGEGEANETTLEASLNYDIFVAGYNGDGTLAWAKRAGGSSSQEEVGRGIASPGDGSCLATGFFSDTTVFGPSEASQTNLVSAGSSDIFIARYEGPSDVSSPLWITDYNGDGTSDIAIFREGSGLWAVRGVTRVYFGSSSDETVPGDYNGDGTTEIGIFRGDSGLWAIRSTTRAYFGSGSDLPEPGDYDGDGTADIGIFRYNSGLWAISGVTRAYFGGSADLPASGYYDGDSTKDIGIFRGSSGLWAIRNVTRVYFGSSSDTIVPGDYDGDGTWETGIFRGDSGLWAIRDVTRSYFGSSEDQPVPGDYKGKGKDDIGIYRDSSGLWAISGVSRVYYGGSGDVPVTR